MHIRVYAQIHPLILFRFPLNVDINIPQWVVSYDFFTTKIWFFIRILRKFNGILNMSVNEWNNIRTAMQTDWVCKINSFMHKVCMYMAKTKIEFNSKGSEGVQAAYLFKFNSIHFTFPWLKIVNCTRLGTHTFPDIYSLLYGSLKFLKKFFFKQIFP